MMDGLYEKCDALTNYCHAIDIIIEHACKKLDDEREKYEPKYKPITKQDDLMSQLDGLRNTGMYRPAHRSLVSIGLSYLYRPF